MSALSDLKLKSFPGIPALFSVKKRSEKFLQVSALGLGLDRVRARGGGGNEMYRP